MIVSGYHEWHAGFREENASYNKRRRRHGIPTVMSQCQDTVEIQSEARLQLSSAVHLRKESFTEWMDGVFFFFTWPEYFCVNKHNGLDV